MNRNVGRLASEQRWQRSTASLGKGLSGSDGSIPDVPLRDATRRRGGAAARGAMMRRERSGDAGCGGGRRRVWRAGAGCGGYVLQRLGAARPVAPQHQNMAESHGTRGSNRVPSFPHIPATNRGGWRRLATVSCRAV
jgi:hypothetical protein